MGLRKAIVVMVAAYNQRVDERQVKLRSHLAAIHRNSPEGVPNALLTAPCDSATDSKREASRCCKDWRNAPSG